MKKIFKFYAEILDVTEYMNKIDAINKQILPKSLLRKKKTEDINA